MSRPQTRQTHQGTVVLQRRRNPYSVDSADERVREAKVLKREEHSNYSHIIVDAGININHIFVGEYFR